MERVQVEMNNSQELTKNDSYQQTVLRRFEEHEVTPLKSIRSYFNLKVKNPLPLSLHSSFASRISHYFFYLDIVFIFFLN